MESNIIKPYAMSSFGYKRERDISTDKPGNLQGQQESRYTNHPVSSTSIDIKPYAMTNFDEAGKGTILKETEDKQDAANTNSKPTSNYEEPIGPTKNKDEPDYTNLEPTNDTSKKPNQSGEPQQNQRNIRPNASSKSFYIIYLSLFIIIILFVTYAYIIMEQEKKMTSLLNKKLVEAVANMTSNLQQESVERKQQSDLEKQERKKQISQEMTVEEQERKKQISQETEDRKRKMGEESRDRKQADDALNEKVNITNGRISKAELKLSSLQSQLDKVVQTSGWYKATDNRYYKYFFRKVNYNEAKTLCSNMGAKLAASGIRNHKSELVNNIILPGASKVLIGLDDLNNGVWEWSDGKRNDIHWGHGQPNPGYEHCGVLYSSDSWKVHDVDCTHTFSFICEKA